MNSVRKAALALTVASLSLSAMPCTLHAQPAPDIQPMEDTDSDGKKREMTYFPRRAIMLRSQPDATAEPIRELAVGDELVMEGFVRPFGGASYGERESLWYAVREKAGKLGFVMGEDLLDARSYRGAQILGKQGALLTAAIEADASSRQSFPYSGIYSASLGCVPLQSATERQSSMLAATNMLNARARTIVWRDNDVVRIALPTARMATPFVFRVTFLRDQRAGGQEGKLYRFESVGTAVPRTEYFHFTSGGMTLYKDERATAVAYRETRCGQLADQGKALAAYLSTAAETFPARLYPKL